MLGFSHGVARCVTICAVIVVGACGSDDDGGGGGGGGDDIPALAYCDDVRSWDDAWRALEQDVLTIVNQRRAEGADCGSEGTFGPADPLTMNGALRCASRLHSMDLSVRGFWDHTNPEGETPWDRFELAGYSWRAAGENIARGSSTAEGVMGQWMGSDGHCSNIMNPSFTEIGVGYYAQGNYWTQGFAAPR